MTAAGAPVAFRSACRAPTVSMYFDQFGNVRACCQNTGTLMGNVTEQSIREIWESADTRRMRKALAHDDYSEGCGFCAWQVEQGDDAIVFARNFDDLPVEEDPPGWPVQMEFSMTNSCNLQCQMCNGDWSSSIRTHREGRAPLPAVYHDEFFAELAQFLPHLHKANFLGGEPFLGREPLRVMSMLADLGHPPEVAVTTNGTQWSERIEQICERLPISFVLSLDGITKDTYESVRIGARFDQVMANLHRFQSYARGHGTTVTLAHCLMRSNWTEFSQLLRFAEDRGLDVGINEVLFPAELSLFQMPASELAEVVSAMEHDEVAAELDTLRHVWDGQLAALRHRLETVERGVHTFIRPWSGSASSESWHAQATRVLTEWAEYPPPAQLEIRAGGSELSGTTTDFLDRFDLDLATHTDEVVARLSGWFDDRAVVTRRYTDMLDDFVISDGTGQDELEFRVTWNASATTTRCLLSVRNHPKLPDDAALQLAAWCGPDRVATFVCDPDDRIVSCSGAVPLLGLGPGADLIGASSDDAFALIAARHGPSIDIKPGPSGYVADTLVGITSSGRASDPTTLDLRVMTERRPGRTTVHIGVAPASSHPSGTPTTSDR